MDFQKPTSNSELLKQDIASFTKKKEIRLQDSYSLSPYSNFEDFSFILKTPQEAAKDMNLFNPYSNRIEEIEWSWKDFREIPTVLPLQKYSPSYTSPQEFYIEDNEWWYSIPNVGSIWLFCFAFLLVKRRR